VRKSCKRVVRSKGHILIGAQLERIVLPLHIALTLLPIGAFTREHADTIAKAINIVFVDANNRSPTAHAAATDAGDVLCAMFKRVNEGKAWNVTTDEKVTLMSSILIMDKHIRTMTTSRFMIAAKTIDVLNAEAKAKGYGFLDKAPVVSNS